MNIATEDLQDTVLATAQEESLVIDFSMGPNQGAGVPAPYNDEGLLWDLDAFNVTVSKGTSDIQSIPGWGGKYNADSLLAAVTGLVVAENANGTEVTLAASSLKDVTSLVNGTDGSLSFEFNATDEGTGYVLFTFYEVHSEVREVAASDSIPAAVPQSPIQTYKENGSWVVDHFSAAGAQVIIDLWNSSLLSGSSSAGIREVGNFFWEDSQEYQTNNSIFWTPKFPEVFSSNRGYNLSTYLPLIVSADLAGKTTFSGITYITDEADNGEAHIEDYEQTVSQNGPSFGKLKQTLILICRSSLNSTGSTSLLSWSGATA